MDEDGERRLRRARWLLVVAVVVIGGSVALVLQQDPPASVGAGVAAAACVLLLSGIADPFLMMLVGNGRNPFASTRHDRDALLAPVEPRTGPPPEPGMWRTDAVFGELARLAEADGGELQVLRTRRRVSIARTDARSTDRAAPRAAVHRRDDCAPGRPRRAASPARLLPCHASTGPGRPPRCASSVPW